MKPNFDMRPDTEWWVLAGGQWHSLRVAYPCDKGIAVRAVALLVPLFREAGFTSMKRGSTVVIPWDKIDDAVLMERCPACLEHPGWTSPDARDAADALAAGDCPGCAGSGTVPPPDVPASRVSSGTSTHSGARNGSDGAQSTSTDQEVVLPPGAASSRP